MTNVSLVTTGQIAGPGRQRVKANCNSGVTSIGVTSIVDTSRPNVNYPLSTNHIQSLHLALYIGVMEL